MSSSSLWPMAGVTRRDCTDQPRRLGRRVQLKPSGASRLPRPPIVGLLERRSAKYPPSTHVSTCDTHWARRACPHAKLCRNSARSNRCLSRPSSRPPRRERHSNSPTCPRRRYRHSAPPGSRCRHSSRPHPRNRTHGLSTLQLRTLTRYPRTASDGSKPRRSSHPHARTPTHDLSTLQLRTLTRHPHNGSHGSKPPHSSHPHTRKPTNELPTLRPSMRGRWIQH